MNCPALAKFIAWIMRMRLTGSQKNSDGKTPMRKQKSTVETCEAPKLLDGSLKARLALALHGRTQPGSGMR